MLKIDLNYFLNQSFLEFLIYYCQHQHHLQCFISVLNIFIYQVFGHCNQEYDKNLPIRKTELLYKYLVNQSLVGRKNNFLIQIDNILSLSLGKNI